MQRLFARHLIAVCVALAISPLQAQPSPPSGDSALPSLKELCTASCPSTEPKRIYGELPAFPKGPGFEGFDSYEHYTEAVVDLDFMIGTDGHVGSMMVKRLIGPPRFLATAQDTVKTWIYAPATENGQPVESDHSLRIVFSYLGGKGATDDVLETYHAAFQQIKSGRLDEADKQLQAKLADPELNLYERAHLLDLRAVIALQHKDYLTARHILDMERVMEPSPDKKTKGAFYTKYLQVNAAIGDVGDVVSTLHTMRDEKLDVPEQLVKLADDMKAQADKAPAFKMSGDIPDPTDGNVFEAALYAKAFSIQNINGLLSKLFISCKNHAVESAVTEKAEWHVPKSWEQCKIFLEGAAGTTFQVVQITQP